LIHEAFHLNAKDEKERGFAAPLLQWNQG